MSTLSLPIGFTSIARRKIEMHIEHGYVISGQGTDYVDLGGVGDSYDRVNSFGIFEVRSRSADLINDLREVRDALDLRLSTLRYPEDSCSAYSEYAYRVAAIVNTFENQISKD